MSSSSVVVVSLKITTLRLTLQDASVYRIVAGVTPLSSLMRNQRWSDALDHVLLVCIIYRYRMDNTVVNP